MMDEDELDMDYDDAFASAVADAFPMEEWTPERTAALKEAIRLCVKKDMGGDEAPPSGPPKKGGLDLAILLGGPKKKAG
jgi:hypothetical protein